VKKLVGGRMLAWVAVAQKVAADPSVSAATSPPQAEPVSRRPAWNTTATVAAAITAESRFTRQSGPGPMGRWAANHPATVYRG